MENKQHTTMRCAALISRRHDPRLWPPFYFHLTTSRVALLSDGGSWPTSARFHHPQQTRKILLLLLVRRVFRVSLLQRGRHLFTRVVRDADLKTVNDSCSTLLRNIKCFRLFLSSLSFCFVQWKEFSNLVLSTADHCDRYVWSCSSSSSSGIGSDLITRPPTATHNRRARRKNKILPN